MFKLLKPYLKKNLLSIIKLFIYLIILFPITVFTPYINGIYIDKLTIFKSKKIVIIFTIIIGIMNIVTIIGNYLSNRLYIKLQTQVGFEMNVDFMEHLKKLPFRKVCQFNPGYISDRINSDCNILSNFIISLILNFFNKFFSTIIIIVIVMKINYRISLLFILLIPLYLIIYNSLKKMIAIRVLKYKESKNEYIAEYYSQSNNIRYIKIEATFYKYRSRLLEVFNNFLKNFLSYIDSVYLFTSIENLVTSIVQLLIVFIGGIQVIEKSVTIGEFTVLLTYSRSLIGTLSYYLNLGKEIKEVNVSYLRLKEILDYEKEDVGTIEITNIEEIVAKDMSIIYDDKKLFKNIDYIFNRGKIYCIKGENGVGKTSFVYALIGILMGDYEGEIKYNGIDLKDINTYKIRENLISVVMQEPSLESDSIYNILNGSCIDKELFTNIGNKLGINKLSEKMENGIHTKINHMSNNISGGEKQKISIFKAFLSNSDLIILDEPTSALDRESCDKLKRYLIEHKKDKIIICISHDNDFIDIADKILILERNSL